MFRILQPWMMLLLILLPLFWLSARNVRVLGRGRKTLALVVRSLVFILLVLCLAEIEYSEQGDRLAIFFILDRSSSIPIDEQQFALTYIQQQIGAIPRDDIARIMFFGKEAVLQQPPGENVNLADYQPMVNTEGTDIEGAIGLAMAAFPEGVQRRIVLLTDGNQTQGDVETAIRRARANGVDVQVMPLRYTYTQEVLVEDVVLPSQIRENEPFHVRVMVTAQEAGPGTLRISENGEIIIDQEVELQPGKNAFSFTREIAETGVYYYDAQVEAENDRRPSNNRAQDFAVVRGMPRVLLLETEFDQAMPMAAALSAEGILVDMRQPEESPSQLRDLQAYDGIILSNVPASRLDFSIQEAMESAVRDLGIGLMMIGGPDSFGAGGYQGTPIERALPVDMDIKQQRVIPSGALVIIMHSTEMPQGNYWTQVISEEAIKVLSRNDYAGFLRYSNTEQESWLFELEKLGNKRRQLGLIRNLAFEDIGDMPTFDPTMELAYEALLRTNTNTKHMIILSDGDPQVPRQGLMNQIRDARITVSTICVNPHQQRDADVMEDLAEFFDGEYYFIEDNTDLPRIFIKEATVIRRNTLVEEPFTPVVTALSELLTGFEAGFPQLDGYVLSSPKPQTTIVLATHKEDPLLAHWRYGLGKAVAFTSDAKSRWASNWLSWDQYSQFWGQIVRWTLRSEQERDFQIQTMMDGDSIRVAIDALGSEGEFINDLNFSAASIDPAYQSASFTIRQTQPGRYEGTITARDPGSYILKMQYEGENDYGGSLTSGITVPYSPEHATTRQNETVLRRMVAAAGTDFIDTESDIFAHNLVASGESTPLWPLLLALAIILFFTDVAVRRVFFELPQLQAAFQRVVRFILSPFRSRLAPAGPATEQMGSLMQAKQRAFEPKTGVSESKDRLLETLDEVDPLPEEDAAPESESKPLWKEARPSQDVPQFEEQKDNEYTSALFRAKLRAKDRENKRD